MSPETKKIQNVIFDIGNVIVKWQPHEALKHLFSSEQEMFKKLTEIGFQDWNLEQDRGRDWQEGFQIIADTKPQHLHIFQAYFDGLEVAHRQKISQVSELIGELMQRKIPIYGLSNAAERSFQYALQTAPILNLFRHITVSARVGMVKPDAEIFEHCLDVNNIEAGSTLFVDDSKGNCEAASALGMAVHQFTDAESLAAELKYLKLINSD